MKNCFKAIRVRLATSIWYGTLMKNCFMDWSQSRVVFEHDQTSEPRTFEYEQELRLDISWKTLYMIMSFPYRVGDILFSPCVRLSVCPSVRLNFRHENLVNASHSTVLAGSFFNFRICFCHGLKTCLMFSCNPQIIFCHFFHGSNLVILGLKAFRHWVHVYLVNATPPTI